MEETRPISARTRYPFKHQYSLLQRVRPGNNSDPDRRTGKYPTLTRIQGYSLAFVYRDRKFEEIARQDASLVYIHTPLDKNKEHIWVAVEIGSSTAMLRQWECCLITWQISHQWPALVTQLDLKDFHKQTLL